MSVILVSKGTDTTALVGVRKEISTALVLVVLVNLEFDTTKKIKFSSH